MLVSSRQYIERIGEWGCIALLAAYLLASIGVAVVILFCLSFLCYWAARKPTWIVAVLKKRHHRHDWGVSRSTFEDAPEKFPGPIALLKKWILSIESGSSPNITWDTGRKGDQR
jgi:hypothetical protein